MSGLQTSRKREGIKKRQCRIYLFYKVHRFAMKNLAVLLAHKEKYLAMNCIFPFLGMLAITK